MAEFLIECVIIFLKATVGSIIISIVMLTLFLSALVVSYALTNRRDSLVLLKKDPYE